MITDIPEEAVSRIATPMWVAGQSRDAATAEARDRLEDATKLINTAGGRIVWVEDSE